MQELADDWMDLVDDTEPEPVICFGQQSQDDSEPGYKLFEAYQKYFGQLLQNLLIMRSESSELKENRQTFEALITKMEDYVNNQVLQGKSDYSSYLNYSSKLLQEHPACKSFYNKLLADYEQGPLPFYTKPKLGAAVVVSSGAEEAKATTVTTKKPEVKQCKLEDIVAQNSQNSNLSKPAINVAIIGHVDHGKSTLLGSILTRQPQPPTSTNNTQEQSKGVKRLSEFTDIYESEQQKGKTLEFSKYTLESLVQKCRINIFDTPGHRNYAANMVVALRVADVALIVVSARKGEFESAMEGGTLKQLIILAHGFGIQRVGVVVNKMETVKFSRNIFDSICGQLKPLLKQFKSVDFLPYDAQLGRNYDSRVFKDCMALEQWFSSLKCQVSVRQSSQVLRMPVFDVNNRSGTRHIYGKIELGFLYKNMPVVIHPDVSSTEPQIVTVNSIYREDEEIPYAMAGDFVSVVIRGAKTVQRGQLIANPTSPPLVSQQILCEIECLAPLLVSGAECMAHLHEIVTQVQLEVISSGGQKATFLKAGQSGKVIVKLLEGRVAVEKTDDPQLSKLGRLALRSGAVTLAIGRVDKIRKPTKK